MGALAGLRDRLARAHRARAHGPAKGGHSALIRTGTQTSASSDPGGSRAAGKAARPRRRRRETAPRLPCGQPPTCCGTSRLPGAPMSRRPPRAPLRCPPPLFMGRRFTAALPRLVAPPTCTVQPRTGPINGLDVGSCKFQHDSLTDFPGQRPRVRTATQALARSRTDECPQQVSEGFMGARHSARRPATAKSLMAGGRETRAALRTERLTRCRLTTSSAFHLGEARLCLSSSREELRGGWALVWPYC